MIYSYTKNTKYETYYNTETLPDEFITDVAAS